MNTLGKERRSSEEKKKGKKKKNLSRVLPPSHTGRGVSRLHTSGSSGLGLAEVGFNSGVGLLVNYEGLGDTVTQRALFYNPGNQSVLIYNITFQHLNIYLLCLQKKRQY